MFEQFNHQCFERNAKICEPLDIEVKKPRICGRQIMRDNVEAESPDTAQPQLVNLHRNRRYFVIKLHTWFCLSYFLKTNITFYCIYQYFKSINSFFNAVSVSRYSRPITMTRDPL